MTKIEITAFKILTLLFCVGFAKQHYFGPPTGPLLVDTVQMEKEISSSLESFSSSSNRIVKKKAIPKEMRLISINHCSERDLQKVKGIGPKLAKRVIEYRSKLADGFKKPADLLKIKGIGPAKLKSLLPQITFD